MSEQFEQLVAENSPRLYRLAYRLTGSANDAEDLVQETFLRALRSWGTFQPGHGAAWLNRITTNLFLDQVRRRSILRFDALLPDLEARLPGRSQAEPAVGVIEGDVEAALATLPSAFRATIVLADAEGLSYDEVAEIMSVKTGTVRSRLHRARALLRKELSHREPRAGRTRYSGPMDRPRLAPGF